jgi:tripartite-type tricarboxylate transporter receptor subunit TctC
MLRVLKAACVMASAIAWSACVAQSPAFPSKPLRMVTQFGPGAPGDLTARVVAGAMSPFLGQPVVVDSRPGGGGVLAASVVARAEQDGYTVAVLTANVPVSGPFLSKTPLPFDPVKDLAPITSIADATSVIAAHPSVQASNLRELLELARRNPDKLSYGTTGIGSSHHLNAEEIGMLAGIRWQHVPYKTSPILDAAAGVIPLAVATAAQTMPLVRSGKVKIVAVINPVRYKLLPDVATVSETLPGFEIASAGMGLYGPGGLAPAVLRRLHGDAVKALGQPEVQAKIGEIGLDVVASKSPEDFAAELRRGIELTRRIVKSAGIEPQ